MKHLLAETPGPPECLRLAEAPLPQPGPNQVRIKVAYAALTPLDVLARQGRVSWLTGKGPFVPGLEFGGIVDALGAQADARLLGRAVVSVSTFGGCAEYALADAARIDPLDRALGWQVGTAWRTPTLTAWYALTRVAALKKGETVMIRSAAGPVGIMAAQIARDSGARAIGLAGGPAKLDYARGFGFDALFDYRDPDWAAKVAAHTGGRGVDAIVDGNGGGSAARNYELIAPGGRIVYIGATSGLAPDPVTIPLLIAKSISVAGLNLNAIDPATLAADEKALAQRLASGAWKFPISEIVELADVPFLHRRFEARETRGRVLIRVAGDL